MAESKCHHHCPQPMHKTVFKNKFNSADVPGKRWHRIKQNFHITVTSWNPPLLSNNQVVTRYIT